MYACENHMCTLVVWKMCMHMQAPGGGGILGKES